MVSTGEDMEKHVQVTGLHCDVASPLFLASKTKLPVGRAQLVEHQTANWKVVGLFPGFGSYIRFGKTFFSYTTVDFGFCNNFPPTVRLFFSGLTQICTSLFLFVCFGTSYGGSKGIPINRYKSVNQMDLLLILVTTQHVVLQIWQSA